MYNRWIILILLCLGFLPTKNCLPRDDLRRWLPDNCPRECTCSSGTLKTVFCGHESRKPKLQAVPRNLPEEVEFLSLYNNDLSSLQTREFTRLRELRNLNLASNNLGNIPPRVFDGLIHLKSLNLGNNNISILDEKLFQGLVNLEELFLDNNQLESFPGNLFAGLISLRHLSAHNNKFTKFPVKALSEIPSLQGLFLDNNYLMSLEDAAFRKMINLQTLTVSFNKISSLKENTFLGLRSLRHLKLHNNDISTLPNGIFFPTVSLNYITLYNNPFKCDCKLKWLKSWIRSNTKTKRIFYQSRIQCASPENRRGIPLIRVTRYKCKSIKWTSWSDWTKCSVTCGTGMQYSYRRCKGKKACQGESQRKKLCSGVLCPVNGNWGGWSEWSQCGVSCGKGQRIRRRSCDRPAPEHGGTNCIGVSYDTQMCTMASCRRHGQWSPWGEWTECSVTCGIGRQKKHRHCVDIPESGGLECPGSNTQMKICHMGFCFDSYGIRTTWGSWGACSSSCGEGTRFRHCDIDRFAQVGENTCQANKTESKGCNLKPCPVLDWGSWTSWTQCNVTCGLGKQSRSRICLNSLLKKSQNGTCQGLRLNERTCDKGKCSSDGVWTGWTQWTSCGVTCGSGIQARVRFCTNPSPMDGGHKCAGQSSDIRSCNTKPCAKAASWSVWSPWQPCSKSCSNGLQKRTRHCNRGLNCSGYSSETKPCLVRECPVQGGWGNWGQWSLCSVSCEEGTKTRRRTCDSPPPKNGGSDCIGDAVDVAVCSNGNCPINGNWSMWSPWSQCSVSCGHGMQSSSRSCDNPKPNFGGKKCSGSHTRTRSCDLNPCPIHGGWASWASWSICSATCSEGSQTRTRECSQPVPQYGGNGCPGNKTEVRSCKITDCPQDGKWSVWTRWSSCSMTCSTGFKIRKRFCNNPKPRYGGRPCDGAGTDLVKCYSGICPVHGGWSHWGVWAGCSVSCEIGIQSRLRNCSNPIPRFGGVYCKGENTSIRSCFMGECHAKGIWSEWMEWSPCSTACGQGLQSRIRICKSLTVAHDVECDGAGVDIRTCKQRDCVFTVQWSDWSQWSTCSTSCGSGQQVRWRVCLNQDLTSSSLNCSSDEGPIHVENQVCQKIACKYSSLWSSWSEWSSCSKSCEGGFHTRNRHCISNILGIPCTGKKFQHRTCNYFACPIHGRWSKWSTWSPCSTTCDEGKKTRFRGCTKPSPMYGGRNCLGEDSETEPCNNGACEEKVTTHPPAITLAPPVTCPIPGPIPKGRKRLESHYDSLYVIYSCEKFYKLDGPKIRHCESNGQWDGWHPRCVPICGRNPTFKNRGEQRARIIGGRRAANGSWPWQVAVGHYGIHCGGSLISDEWIITAAHCVLHKNTQETFPVIIYLGVYDLTERHKDPYVQIIPSLQVVAHPSFDWKTYDSDIALVKLKWRATISDKVLPVCLPTKKHYRKLFKPPNKGTMVGWGVTENGQPADKLHEVGMPLVHQHICQKAYKEDEWKVTDNMFCAGFPTLGNDSCDRDSGSGLVFQDVYSKGRYKKWILAGVVSWGNPECGTPGKYSVFTKVVNFISWIRKHRDS